MGKEDWYDHTFKWPCGFVLILPVLVVAVIVAVWWRRKK